jgi:hypothetical protein
MKRNAWCVAAVSGDGGDDNISAGNKRSFVCAHHLRVSAFFTLLICVTMLMYHSLSSSEFDFFIFCGGFF